MAALDDLPLEAALLERTDGGTVTVLHVDDDPDFCDLVQSFLGRESEDLRVITETSASAALERLETDAVDCIVSDYDMPGVDGLAFLETVRESYPELPFILFTGKGSEEIASEAISAGVTDYLQKGHDTSQYAVLANRIENVTEQYQVQREVERGLQAIETTQEGIAFLDDDGTIVFVNPAFADLFGYDRETLLGMNLDDLTTDRGDELDEIWPEVRADGQWTGEVAQRTEDGSAVNVELALSASVDGTVLCCVRDITEAKETADALDRERRRFEEFVEAVTEYAIFALDTEGYVTSWNRGAERVKGYSEAEIIGEHFSRFYPEAKAESGYPDDLLARALAEGSVEDEGWRVRKDGSRFWANVVITPVFDDGGNHRGFLKVTRDMTDRREARRALETERDLLDRALDVVDDLFLMLDREGEIVRVTERATEMTGYSRNELLSMSGLDLLAPDDRDRVEADHATTPETGASTSEAELLTKAGRTIPFEFRRHRLEVDGRVYIVGIGRDISERKRRERQLSRQLEQFEHFGSVLSHDLRNPLQVALGKLELARQSGDEADFEQAEAALQRLDALIDDLSGVMQEGELVSDVAAVDLRPCLRSVWSAMETGSATLTVETDLTIRADEQSLKRLAENLFRNALEHGSDPVSITVGAVEDGFFLEDNGPGIPEAERDQVFEAGYSSKDDGQGFGLASVRQLVVAHGWQITATDCTGGGARFEITDVEIG